MNEASESTASIPVAPVALPAAIAEELLGYGLQTAPGKVLWRGYLLGAGLPPGDGQVTIVEAHYVPAPGRLVRTPPGGGEGNVPAERPLGVSE